MKNWLKRTITSWKHGDTMPSVEYEEINISTMEIPPGFRGYGAKGNLIEHPQSEVRQKEVDELTENLKQKVKIDMRFKMLLCLSLYKKNIKEKMQD